MARRVFFSFHYQPDVNRANVVKNAWMGRDREDAGFFNSSVVEATKRTSDEALKRFLREGMNGSSVVCILTGAQTAQRRWVRYETLMALRDNRGLVEVAIHNIRCMRTQTGCLAGTSILSQLGYWFLGEKVHFAELSPTNQWVASADVPSLPASEFRWNTRTANVVPLSTLFHRHEWVAGNGYASLGGWVETAARQVGR